MSCKRAGKKTPNYKLITLARGFNFHFDLVLKFQKGRPNLWNVISLVYLTGSNYIFWLLFPPPNKVILFHCPLFCLFDEPTGLSICRCLNHVIHQISRKWTVTPLNIFYGKLWVVFYHNTGKSLSERNVNT